MAMTDERAMLMMKNYLDMGMGYGKPSKKKKVAKVKKKKYTRRA
jgi:heptaprenylglyceryl phosphate synthase